MTTATAKAAKTCLVVDDETLIAMHLTSLAKQCGFEVRGMARSCDEAIETALRERPQCILMDVRLYGERDGIDASNEIWKHYAPRIIYITGSREQATMDRINQNHPHAILLKPVDPAILRQAMTS